MDAAGLDDIMYPFVVDYKKEREELAGTEEEMDEEAHVFRGFIGEWDEDGTYEQEHVPFTPDTREADRRNLERWYDQWPQRRDGDLESEPDSD